MTKLKNFTFLVIFSLFAVQGFGQSVNTTPVFSDNTRCAGTNAEVQATFLLNTGGAAHVVTWRDASNTDVVATTSSTAASTSTSGIYTVSTQVFGTFVVATLTIADVTGLNGATFDVNITETGASTAQSVDSDALTVNANPTINSFVALSTCESATPTLTADATATNMAAISYNWAVRQSGSFTMLGNSTGTGTGASATLTAVSSAMAASYDNQDYRFTITEDATGCEAESTVSFGLNVDAAPSITTQPDATAAYCSGSNVTLSVAGTGATNYIWKNDGGATLQSGTSPSYMASTADVYSVVLENDGCKDGSGAVTSNNATVTQSPTLAITAQPSNGTVTTGGNQSFSVTVTAGAGRSVIWTLDGETLTNGSQTAAGIAAGSGSNVTIDAETNPSANSYTYGITISNVVAADVSKSIQASITDECGTVVSNQAALPVDLVSFTGTQVKNTVELAWETASELNNDYFSIERSTNGSDFVELGQVVGAGSTAEYSYYQFVDEKPSNGANYYRLKQVDFDGQFEYSDVIVVKAEGIQAASLSINPTASENRISINMDTPFEVNTMVTITNSVGQVVLQDNILAGQNVLDIDIQNLNAGQFNITFSNENELFTRRFIKL